MKTIINKLNILTLLIVSLFFAACSNDDSDNRAYESVQVVGVKVDGTLYMPTHDNGNTTVVLPAGKDLSNVQVELLVENGKASNFINNNLYDMRKPIDLILNGFNGDKVAVKLRVQSPPKLTTFNIEKLDVPSEKVFVSEKSIIVQVDKGTDLTNLVVNMNFVNGSIQQFENGIAHDYTTPVSFSVLGVDGETSYPYDLIITTDPVGPATVKAMSINGIKTSKIEIVEGNVIVPFIQSLTDFTNANIVLEVGYGNTIDPAFTGNSINLMSGNNKVKITGTNGQVTEFTIGVPQLDPEAVFIKDYASTGFAANDLGAVGFSGEYILAGNYTQGTKAPTYFNYKGEKIGQMSVKNTAGIGYGFRKFACDENGLIIGSSLGISAGEQWIYKWNSVTADPESYISFSKASLDVNYNPRAAGINVYGSLLGNAVVTMASAQQTDVFIWKITNGVVGTSKKFTSPIKFGYYASVQPLPDNKGYLLAAAASQLNGIIVLNDKFQEQFRLTGMPMTDLDVVKYNDRIYLAYVVMVGGNTPTMRVCDITDGQESSYKAPILNMPMQDKAANANVTTDAAFKVINGKLHAAFVSSNADMYLFKLEQ